LNNITYEAEAIVIYTPDEILNITVLRIEI